MLSLLVLAVPAAGLLALLVLETSEGPRQHTYWEDEQAAQTEALERDLADGRIDLDGPGYEIVDGGFGWGSAAPFADGAQPPGHPVKGERAAMRYHPPGSAAYGSVHPDVWFVDPAAAERAGFHRA